ncbi:MAG: 4-alpha-glucanotransferase [Bacteroidales bacterium]|nr:4-alpha-glucanotransferase [Bacteroidales bacterium]
MNITDQHKDRSAGILLHISSLPGRFSCGDFGPEAYKFARRLAQAGQKIWQILPLNPLDSSKGFSPYSPLSAFAGNTLLISPETLAETHYIEKIREKDSSKDGAFVDYNKALKQKEKYLREAFTSFEKKASLKTRTRFEIFCESEAHWLNDFALYISIRNKLNTPWYAWPEKLRNRDPEAMMLEKKELVTEIRQEKFYQFLFSEQWHALKSYCHQQGIKIVGDIPIYTSHDSADVWANPEFFKLAADKSIGKSAGVPPDYFNANGQLWNMPVYDWKALEKTDFSWWIERLRKNLELYDIVRLDHFRGFSSYWEVDGNAENAIKGKWIKGPAEKFLDLVQDVFPEMPFIAEDLGDVDQPVFDLRDRYGLPGMRILQFAFEGDMPRSIFIPHNYTVNSIVYTGTHDNNTVKGWFNKELSKRGRKNASRYLARKLSPKNCHSQLIREAYRSVARLAIIPMQDVLGLGGKYRMNFPSTESGNWLWRMRRKEFKKKEVSKLKELCELFNR